LKGHIDEKIANPRAKHSMVKLDQDSVENVSMTGHGSDVEKKTHLRS
jgi:hypothetical protein